MKDKITALLLLVILAVLATYAATTITQTGEGILHKALNANK